MPRISKAYKDVVRELELEHRVAAGDEDALVELEVHREEVEREKAVKRAEAIRNKVREKWRHYQRRCRLRAQYAAANAVIPEYVLPSQIDGRGRFKAAYDKRAATIDEDTPLRDVLGLDYDRIGVTQDAGASVRVRDTQLLVRRKQKTSILTDKEVEDLGALGGEAKQRSLEYVRFLDNLMRETTLPKRLDTSLCVPVSKNDDSGVVEDTESDND